MSRRRNREDSISSEGDAHGLIPNKSEVLKAFEFFDKDGTGNIGKEELKYILTKLEINISDQDVEEVFNECEVGDSPTVNYRELIDFLENL
jgi:Ca2+-binding EF-hand superfamily protein